MQESGVVSEEVIQVAVGVEGGVVVEHQALDLPVDAVLVIVVANRQLLHFSLQLLYADCHWQHQCFLSQQGVDAMHVVQQSQQRSLSVGIDGLE